MVRKTISSLDIRKASAENAHAWASVFLEAMKGCKWMSKYLANQQINEVDVALSFFQDLEKRKTEEIFLIAYHKQTPIGIIRIDEYWIPGTMKILSHFPLVIPKYQRRGVGKALVLRGIQEIQQLGKTQFWSECWSKDPNEIKVYTKFYQAMGFEKQSDRLEMVCQTEKFEYKKITQTKEFSTTVSEVIEPELVQAISAAYAESKDKLHKIERLDKPEVTTAFLQRTKKMFINAGFIVNCTLAYSKGDLCAGLLTATKKEKAMILEIGVLPKYRKLGFAKKLIANYIHSLKVGNIPKVVLGVDVENYPAVELYKQLGFRNSWQGAVYLLSR